MKRTKYTQVSFTVMSTAFFAMALCVLSSPSFAQAPGWSRGQQLLSITYDECVDRAKLALQAESYRIDHAAGNFAVGVKEVHTAVIMCNPVADAKVVVNIVVVSNGEGGGSQRQRLQAQMERTTPTTPPQPAPQPQPQPQPQPPPQPQPQPPVTTGLQTCITTSMEGLSDKRGQRLSCTCPSGSNAWVIEGTDTYRHNSDICVAAVHAGLITFQNGGTVTIEVLRDNAPNFSGSERNGVKSFGSQYAHLAFRFASGANVAAFQRVTPEVEALPEDELKGPNIEVPTANIQQPPANGATAGSLGPNRDGWGFNNQTATKLRFFGSTSAASCRAECEKDAQCMAYSWIRPNGYVPGDPPMCYLMSSWTGGVQHPCCISAVKNSPTHGGDFEAFGRPTGKDDKPKQLGAQRWILESVTVTPEDPAKVWTRPQEQKWEYSKDSTSARFTLHGGATGDTASFQWSPPPQQVDSNGFTINFSVQSPKSSMSMNVWAVGLQGEAAGISTGPNNTSVQKTANFKPSPNADGFEVKISVGWGAVTYTYKYRRAQ